MSFHDKEKGTKYPRMSLSTAVGSGINFIPDEFDKFCLWSRRSTQENSRLWSIYSKCSFSFDHFTSTLPIHISSSGFYTLIQVISKNWRQSIVYNNLEVSLSKKILPRYSLQLTAHRTKQSWTWFGNNKIVCCSSPQFSTSRRPVKNFTRRTKNMMIHPHILYPYFKKF